MKLTSKHFLLLSLITLFGFSAMGVGIIWFFQEKSVAAIFTSGGPWYKQLWAGATFGAVAAFNAILLIKTPLLESTRRFFANFIAHLKPSFAEILFYSFCAAVGEEILFRGAIQHHLGIWWTSVLFIFIHGYLNPLNTALLLYGVLMVVISAGLGYLYELSGLYAAITAHFLFDVSVFAYLKYRKKPQPHTKGEQEESPEG